MKKKLEADLISIAHRILKLKNKSELEQLYLETGKLYEKLSVLRFVETHFADVKPTIGHSEVSDKLVVAFENEEETPEFDAAKEDLETPAEVVSAENEIEETAAETSEDKVASGENDEDTEETSSEHIHEQEIPEAEEVNSVEEEAEAADEEHEIQETEDEEPETSETETTEAESKQSDDFAQESAEQNETKPSFELSFERKEENNDDKKAPQQISFEDLLGQDYTETIFEKVSDRKKEEPVSEEKQEETKAEPEAVKEESKPEETPSQNFGIDKSEYEKPAATSDLHGKAITFGLNDRIGFEKNLFGGSSEDMNRVISQLNTFNSFQEAQDFIDDMVKPDYNNWDNKDDYAKRFMEIVEKKFN